MRQKWFILTIIVILGIALIGYGIGKRSEITPGDWMQIMLLLALVVVTGAYAWSASIQADASKKMANSMKEQYLSTFKPFIILVYENKKLSDSFIKNFTINCIHERGGAALKLKLFVKSDIFEFASFDIPSPMFEKTSTRYTFGVKTTDIDASNMPPKFSFIVVAEYEDTSGNKWKSTLNLFWDAVIKDIKVKGITVGNSRN